MLCTLGSFRASDNGLPQETGARLAHSLQAFRYTIWHFCTIAEQEYDRLFNKRTVFDKAHIV